MQAISIWAIGLNQVRLNLTPRETDLYKQSVKQSVMLYPQQLRLKHVEAPTTGKHILAYDQN